IPAGAAHDVASNPTAASTSTDNVVTFDNVAPTVTINQAAGQADPTTGAPILYDVVFSEPVTGFTESGVSIAGSTADIPPGFVSVSGVGANYTVEFDSVDSDGTVVASILAGVAHDAAGNGTLASTSTDNTVTVDTTPPTVTINQAAAQSDPTNASSILYSVAFSEAVTGFTGTDISFTGSTVGGALAAAVTDSGDHKNYTVTVTGMTSSGNVVASVVAGAATDAANNASTASTSTDNTVTFDNVAPKVTINQAVGQTGPTNSSSILYKAVSSEGVSVLATGDVTLPGTAGATTATVTDSGDHKNYTVTVTGMTTSGTVIATIGAGKAHDAASNPNAASTSTDNTVTFDN